MSTVAEQLRQAREAQNLSVREIAEITKIRTDHVRAIEEGNFDVFSAPVYIKGFVRSYSTLLKLDTAQVMKDLEAELRGTQKFAEPPPLMEQKKGALDFVMLQLSKLDWRKGVFIGALIATILLVLLISAIARHYRNSDPLKGLKPGVYQPKKPLTNETLPLPKKTKRRG
jgi:cytoskeletal protein RodZ